MARASEIDYKNVRLLDKEHVTIDSIFHKQDLPSQMQISLSASNRVKCVKYGVSMIAISGLFNVSEQFVKLVNPECNLNLVLPAGHYTNERLAYCLKILLAPHVEIDQISMADMTYLIIRSSFETILQLDASFALQLGLVPHALECGTKPHTYELRIEIGNDIRTTTPMNVDRYLSHLYLGKVESLQKGKKGKTEECLSVLGHFFLPESSPARNPNSMTVCCLPTAPFDLHPITVKHKEEIQLVVLNNELNVLRAFSQATGRVLINLKQIE